MVQLEATGSCSCVESNSGIACIGQSATEKSSGRGIGLTFAVKSMAPFEGRRSSLGFATHGTHHSPPIQTGR